MVVEWFAHFLVPLALGLLGFIEPCSIGGHLAFLSSLAGQSTTRRLTSLAVFTAARTTIFGALGIVVSLVGLLFVDGQKIFWFLFGLAYIVLGAVYLAGKAVHLMRGIGFAADSSSRSNSLVLGLILGLNVPACAAPLLFAVAGSAVGASTFLLGFTTLAVFGLALSAPLFVVALAPGISNVVLALGAHSRRTQLTIGGVLVLVGVWAALFGLFVDPADWQLQQK
jgi:cytochrome c-type biogenesis protein